MIFNINDFKAQGLPLGGARPSLFQVEFPALPAGLNLIGNADARLSYLVQSASIPPSAVDEVPVPYFGRKIKYAGERAFADWTVTILNDEDFSARDLFESWSNQINSLVGNLTTNGLVAYKVDNTLVKQYGKAGDIIRSYTFHGLWPKVVSDIQLDWAQASQMEVFQVQFAVDYWLPAVADGQTSEPSYSGFEPGTIVSAPVIS